MVIESSGFKNPILDMLKVKPEERYRIGYRSIKRYEETRTNAEGIHSRWITNI